MKRVHDSSNISKGCLTFLANGIGAGASHFYLPTRRVKYWYQDNKSRCLLLVNAH